MRRGYNLDLYYLQEDDDEEGEGHIEVKDPTHHSELDPKSMKVIS